MACIDFGSGFWVQVVGTVEEVTNQIADALSAEEAFAWFERFDGKPISVFVKHVGLVGESVT